MFVLGVNDLTPAGNGCDLTGRVSRGSSLVVPESINRVACALIN